MTRSLVFVSVTLSSALLFPSAPIAQAPAGPPRTVYVTVTDRNGVPVTDLTAADFAVKEGGKAVQVAQAGISTTQLQIALIVDDNGTGLFRAPLAKFVQRMDGHAAMALSSVVGQTMKVVDYTTRVDALQTGLATLNARPGTPDGGQLLEGISEAAIELHRREAPRPVIIALTVAPLDRRCAAPLRAPAGEPQPAEGLGDGPRQSGGRHTEITPTAGSLTELQRLASELLQQYQISYTLPPGIRPSDRLAVTVTRKGLSVRAPTRIRS